MKRKQLGALGLGLALTALTACTSGNAGIEPTVRSIDPASVSKLTFAIGTANIAGTAGLNVVATFRQTNGATATLVNSPTITGPAGFVVPAVASAFGDAGGASINSQPQALSGIGVAQVSTFGVPGGVFGAGFAPANVQPTDPANFPRITGSTGTAPSATSQTTGLLSPAAPRYATLAAAYGLPLYGTNAQRAAYFGGPPAFPTTRDNTFATGFTGYLEGFTDFAATPVAGAYSLNLNVPLGTTSSESFPATATLNSVALLPAFAAPTFVADGLGGGTVTAVLPAGVTEALVNIIDYGAQLCHGTSAPSVFTARFTASGSVTIPDTLGQPPAGSSTFTPSICTAAQNNAVAAGTGGDTYSISAVGFDYPAFAALYPQSKVQVPALAGANGQTDITTAPVTAFVSP